MEMIEKKCMVKGCDNMVYVDDSSHFLVICPKHRKGLDNNSR